MENITISLDTTMNSPLGWLPSARTRTIGIIGDPIEHSLTPRIQNAALREAGADVQNVAFRVGHAQLSDAVQGAKSLGFLGLMVTIPHKEAVLDLCDELDLSAQSIGAANLLHFRSDGATVGYATDGWAALSSLAEEGVEVRGSRITLLGSGGGARSLAMTFARAGAQTLYVLNRTPERARRLVEEIAALDTPGLTCRALPLDTESLHEIMPRTDLLVNASSVGMYPRDDESPVPSDVLHDDLAVYDIVYNPLETKLLRDARLRGATPIDGLGMLIYTNVSAGETCANIRLSPEVMRTEALRVLGK